MKLSRERLIREAEVTGFRPEILEKVVHLMGLLSDFKADPFLATRVALKGGTALNLFHYECPRLSVDIDINYIGSANREVMMQERGQLVSAVHEICQRRGYRSQRKPSEHAGGKWTLRYQSALQGNPRLEVDLNFLSRVPLWKISEKSSFRLGSYQVEAFPVLDTHDLVGGKLAALFSRHASRDLFDVYHIMQDDTLNKELLRIAFIVYGGMSRKDWRKISLDDVQYEWYELKNMLVPTLSVSAFTDDGEAWSKALLTTCRKKLSYLFPFRPNEAAFLDRLLDFGEIKPELLTDDKALSRRIALQPGLLWKAQNVKAFKASKQQTGV